MEPLDVAGYDTINGRCGASTCIMVMMFCAITAKASLHRFKEGGFNVNEKGTNVAYKVMDGRAWYKMAEQAGDAKKNKSDTFAVVIASCPTPPHASRPTRTCSRPTSALSPSRSC